MKKINPFLLLQQSPIHGSGVFAAKDLKSGQRLIRYTGRIIGKAESAKLCEDANPFIFHLDDEFDLDGDVPENEARFINHSCEPNCSAQLVRRQIWIITERAIKAGEEISFDYGYDLENYRDYPCRCGAQTCRGYIVAAEYFQ